MLGLACAPGWSGDQRWEPAGGASGQREASEDQTRSVQVVPHGWGPGEGISGARAAGIKAWAGKGRAVGTFEAGSPWKSHGLKQELLTPSPPEQCCQHLRPQESRGHGLRVPILCSRP